MPPIVRVMFQDVPAECTPDYVHILTVLLRGTGGRKIYTLPSKDGNHAEGAITCLDEYIHPYVDVLETEKALITMLYVNFDKYKHLYDYDKDMFVLQPETVYQLLKEVL